MATSRIDRSDDTAAVLKIIATVAGTEDAVTKQWQAVTISDSTDPVTNKLAINVGGAASVIGASNSGVDVGDVTINNAAGAAAVNVQDGGNTLTVDGTVTANLSATDNAVLDAIEADTTTIAGAVAGTEMQVDVLTMPSVAVTNAGTFAVQSDTELTTADLDTGAGTDTRAVVGLVGSKSGGGELIPGSATDGLLVNLGANNDVTLTSTTVTGTVAVTQSGTWDEVGINDSGNSITVDNAQLSVVGTGTEAAALRVTLASDSTGLVSVDDNGGAITVDWAGTAPPIGAGTEATALRVTVATDSTGVLSVDDNGGILTVDGTVTANLSATDNAVLDAIAASTAAIDTDTSTIATSLGIMDDWDNAASDGASVSGDVAHDSADAGEPVKIGGQARTTNPTAVADSDRANAMFDDLGRQVVVLNHVRDLVVQQHASNTDGAETTILAAGAAGVFHDLVSIHFANTSATGVLVDIRDATAGSVIDRFYVPATQSVGKVFSTPFKQTAAAGNWTMDSSSAISTLYCTVQAIKNL